MLFQILSEGLAIALAVVIAIAIIYHHFSELVCVIFGSGVCLFYFLARIPSLYIESLTSRIRKRNPALAEIEPFKAQKPSDSPVTTWLAIMVEAIILAIMAYSL
jgi:hypothetical protein